MSVFVNSDGGLTTMGYAACAALILFLLVAVGFIKGDASESQGRPGVRKLAFCSMCIALAAATSMIKVFEWGFGGSVTLCSMLFAVLPAWFYGVRTGFLCGLIYSLLQFILGPYILTPLQVCFDYLFAFTVMGVAGFFKNSENGLLKGYIAAVFGRWIMATVAGLIWVSLGSVVWSGWPPILYSMVYNISYIGLEAVLTVVIISVPAVKKALAMSKKQVVSF